MAMMCEPASSSSSSVAVAAMPEAKANAAAPPSRSGSAASAREGGERRLQRVARRIARARVVVALVHAGTRLHVGGGGVDRRHHRTGERVGMLSAVDHTRRKALYGF